MHRHRFECVADDELGAAATDVHHDPPRGGARNAVRHPEIDQARLFAAGDDIDAMAERFACPSQNAARVACPAQGIGTDGPNLLGAEVPEPLPEQGEALDRAFLRRLIERAVFLKAHRQADRLTKAIDDLNAAMIDPRDHHVKAVRPQVYCSERLHARPKSTLA